MENPKHIAALKQRNAQITREACEWFVEFRSGEPDDAAREAFYAWLRESPRHMDAYLQLTAIWNESPAVDSRGRWTREALIAEAAVDTDNVVSLTAPLAAPENEASGSAVTPMPQKSSASGGLALFPGTRGARMLLAASLLLTIGAISAWLLMQRATYGTAIGEQRFIALADGSTVNLNSRSRIKVRYSDRERVVQLQAGQALFEVAKDPARPFVVVSGDTRVRAVGTRFDVYRKVGGTIITVIEGRVAVLPSTASEEGGTAPKAGKQLPGVSSTAETPQGEVLLSAAQQLRVVPDAVPQAMSVDVARATSWTQRQLVFVSTPLAEVAEEFNRYNPRQLTIRDPALDTFLIDGVFSSTDPASLIRFLRTRPGVRVTETASGIAIDSQ